MQIFTQESGSSLMIGDDVTVTVLALKGKAVLLGTEAPKDIPVHRNELYQRIHGLDSNRSGDVWIYTAPKAVLRLLSNKLRQESVINTSVHFRK
ncbi:carbon storage regulator [Neptunomonas qingdaonensis]|uniref:Carbon storage regulator, CsrA n=1 Tax=Neptunomonas qingdaonensis TaxID=1045558 RepID=A0A1I2Q8G2_9GAMM|nr:carbon storage regulator, CsrA [Neptunomonas qingdaonensis]